MSVNTITTDNINVKSLSTMDILVAALRPALCVVDGIPVDSLDSTNLTTSSAFKASQLMVVDTSKFSIGDTYVIDSSTFDV